MATSNQSSSTVEVSSGPDSNAAPTQGTPENSPILITSHKLNGHNYLQWSQSVMMFVCGKGRDDFLTGATAAPKQDDPNFRTWNAANNMVMSWLINSMNNEIGENFLLYSTAKEIWDAAKETYSSSENTSELFEVESHLHDLRQGESSVTIYFNTLSRYWQQLDLFEVHHWKCTEDESQYKKIVEKKRVFQFLLGLNKDLDDVRGRVLSTRPLPTIREAFSEVRREESRKRVMMGPSNTNQSADGSALAVRGAPNSESALAARGASQPFSDSKPRRGRPWCEHCHKPGHFKETCWKIHGKPADWKPSRNNNDRESRGNLASPIKAQPSQTRTLLPRTS